MTKTPVTAQVAAMMCEHRPGGDLACVPCAARSYRRITAVGEDLVVLAAKSLMRLDGYGKTAPTPLTYLAAVELLEDLLPAIRAAG